MQRTLVALACTFGLAAIAEAQPGVVQPRGFHAQTAMTALGQTNVLQRQSTRGYRTAAHYGGQSAGQARVQQAGLLGTKPFSASTNVTPTISPYLNLFRDESREAAPNYFTFVRPMQQQYETAHQQQMQLQRLQRQVQQATYTSPATAGVAGGARYGDTGRYYSGWRR